MDKDLFFLNIYGDTCRRHHTFRLLILDQSEIYTIHTRNTEHTVKSNIDKDSKGRYLQGILTDLFGQGIFFVDGVNWPQQRKLACFEFSTRVQRDFCCTIFRRNAGKLVRNISEFSMERNILHIQVIWNSIIIEISKINLTSLRSFQLKIWPLKI